MKTKILFLGRADSPVFEWLQKRGENALATEEKITTDFIEKNNFNFLISYG